MDFLHEHTESLSIAFQDSYKIAEEKLQNWLALLPSGYQQDVYGITWPTIIITSLAGIFFIWIMLWRSRVSQRKQTMERLLASLAELKAQLDSMANEKLDQEKEFKEAQVQLDRSQTALTDMLETKGETERLMEDFKKTIENLRKELDLKVQNVSEYNVKLITTHKEKKKLEKEVEQARGLIEQHLKKNQECEIKVNQLTNHVKDLTKQRKMEEDVSNNLQERLKCEEKAKVEIEQKLVKSIESQDVLN
uniref:Uncharacterized protein n=1 Tax=Ciona savignyi TaxID=51511 RepID=H2YCI2_CIOSA